MTAMIKYSRLSGGPGRSRQRGAAQLFITIVLLAVIMMLGITATIISSTQFKLAGNLQFENQAFDNAEAAAAKGLSWLTTGCNGQNYVIGNATYLLAVPKTAGHIDAFNFDWDSKAATVVDSSRQYVIQLMAVDVKLGGLGTGQPASFNDQRGNLFRITSRGTSAKGTARIVQTNVYVKKEKACEL